MDLFRSVLACIVLISSCKASADYEEKGFGVGLVHKPTNCKRVTKRGDHIAVKYNGTFVDGSTYVPTSKKPFEFTLGEGQVITGWDLGLLGMCVGEIRQLVVPSHVAYGNWPVGDKVPPKSTIEFFVELLQIKDTFTDRDMVSDTFSQIDTNGDSMLSNDEVAKFLKKQNYPDGPGEKSHSHIIREIFLEEDKNSDGTISHKEFSGPKKYIGDL
ncbi:FK506-binding 2-like [Paramuricea clavata]|uniref:peptidylprolyl isomerase n=1 Tax=Paramuricea clavata TaxID=317549 RepID=A0A6S7G5I0_PARCT|nr:FK506-binding 2-like [Paramuricea clavata]